MAGIIPGSDSGLQRLKIECHELIDCSGTAKETLVLQTNPEKLDYSFGIDSGNDAANATNAEGVSAPPPVFSGYQKMMMNFSFFADATGIVPVNEDNKSLIEISGTPSIKKILKPFTDGFIWF